MEAIKSLSHRCLAAPARVRRLAAPMAFTALVALAASGVGTPSDALQGRSDEVTYSIRTGGSKTWRGTIKENSLTQTVIESGGRDRKISSDDVRRVAFRNVPPSFEEGEAYFDRKDFENAAAKFQVAATDASASEIVKAAARMRAAGAWISQTTTDSGAFASAAVQLETFLTDFPENRSVPEARLLLGRVKWMSGDFTGASETYRSLYGMVQADTATAGYPVELCYRAGLAAADTTLAKGDREAARDIYSSVATALTSIVAASDANLPALPSLQDTHARARLGEGFCLLAASSVSQARTFFQGQLENAPKTGSQRFGARLGLAESLLADGRFREAQFDFARVSALDHTSRDRVARALVGLAECAIKLSDATGRTQAKRWLDTVQAQYADTPSMLRAQELLKNL